MNDNFIKIRGARVHNLKNIDLDIPKNKLVVITGLSGSGKSSLAFDTIYAEGQRRYVESLSAYARQFLGVMDKPDVDRIEGLSPAIAIDQKSVSKNPRSTVGTITEIYDYLRLLFSRVGEPHCPECGEIITRQSPSFIVDQIIKKMAGLQVLILGPMIRGKKGEHHGILEQAQKAGFARARIDGIVYRLEEALEIELDKNKKHNIEVVVDRLIINAGIKKRLTDSIELALKHGHSNLIIHVEDREDLRMSESRTCCGKAYPELHPNLFSFNSPLGMCPDCNGIGSLLLMDPDKIIPDKNLSIRQGAVVPWKNYFLDFDDKKNSWGISRLKAMQKQWGMNIDIPWKDLPKKIQNMVLFGQRGQQLKVNWQSENFKGEVNANHEGLVYTMMRRYKQTTSESAKKYYAKFLSDKPCNTCQGRRLRSEALSVKIDNKSINDVTNMSIGDAFTFIKNLNLTGNKKIIASELFKEINGRLSFLVNVGLDYLSLNRSGPTLSGGESQRIRLASQIGSELTGVLYILDEPSIGLHQKDNAKLIQTLKHLRDIGNTLIVVEHDQETMESSDWIVDIGPGAGHLGGQVVAQGTLSGIIKNKHSLTGMYLSGKKTIEVPPTTRPIKLKFLEIIGANQNNLQNINVKIPLGIFVTITGVSGAGKSSLINQILFPALSQMLNNSQVEIGKHKSIKGLQHLDKIINIDQKPIGRTPRSNPATYTKVFDNIRDLFAMLPESKERGYNKGRFSFNVKGGRCEHCEGDGFIKVEMHFLADVYVPCEKCNSKRFNQSTLEVLYKGHSISDVLELSVLQAYELFSNHPQIKTILKTLIDVGLGYIKLGQSATTLSGGEAQRIKLARELAKRATGDTLYLLDEPTTGLHFQDIKMLLKVLNRLVDAGNSVLVIEHNLDVIKSSDWVIDMGPDGGKKGGRIVAEGTPKDLTKVKESYTGQFLKRVF